MAAPAGHAKGTSIRPRSVTLTLVLVVGLIAGCGGDDETTTTASTTASTTTTAPSGVEEFESGGGLLPDGYAADVSAICEKGQGAIEQAYLELGSSADPTAVSDAVTGQIVPIIQGQIDDIRALGTPDEGADELEKFLDEAQSAVDEVEKSPNSLFAGEPFGAASLLAVRLGVPACAV